MGEDEGIEGVEGEGREREEEEKAVGGSRNNDGGGLRQEEDVGEGRVRDTGRGRGWGKKMVSQGGVGRAGGREGRGAGG